MGEKKGQLTIFVILAVVVVIVVGVVVIQDGLFKGAFVVGKVSALNDNIIDCYEKLALENVEVVGYQGGYYNVPANVFEDGDYFMPYYYDHGELNIPTIYDIERELGNAIDENIDSCLQGYDGFDLEYGESKTSVKIDSKDVMFTTELKINVNYDDKVAVIDLGKSRVSVASKFLQMRDLAEFFVSSVKRDVKEWIPLSSLESMAAEKGLYVRLLNYDDTFNNQQVILYSGDMEKFPLVYRFMMGYNYVDLELPIEIRGEGNE